MGQREYYYYYYYYYLGDSWQEEQGKDCISAVWLAGGEKKTRHLTFEFLIFLFFFLPPFATKHSVSGRESDEREEVGWLF